MTDEQKVIVKLLRCEVYTKTCEDCEKCNVKEACMSITIKEMESKAAYLIERMAEELQRAKRERDALLVELIGICHACKHYKAGTLCEMDCRYNDKWEWRGLCAENGGAEDANL